MYDEIGNDIDFPLTQLPLTQVSVSQPVKVEDNPVIEEKKVSKSRKRFLRRKRSALTRKKVAASVPEVKLSRFERRSKDVGLSLTKDKGIASGNIQVGSHDWNKHMTQLKKIDKDCKKFNSRCKRVGLGLGLGVSYAGNTRQQMEDIVDAANPDLNVYHKIKLALADSNHYDVNGTIVATGCRDEEKASGARICKAEGKSSNFFTF